MTQPTKKTVIGTSILLFIIVIALGNLYDIIVRYTEFPTLTYQWIYVAMPAITIIAFILFVKLTKSSLKKQGYQKPQRIKTWICIVLAIVLVITYLVVIFMQSFFGTLGAFRFPTSPYSIAYRIVYALLFALATESVFRGYIFRNLARNYGFFTSLYVSAILFSVHQISLNEIVNTAYGDIPFYIFTRVVPLLAAGLFLGFFFYKTSWSLLGPLIFRIGTVFFFEPIPLLSVTSLWWVGVTFEMLAFAILILAIDSIIQEPTFIRKKYGLD